MADVMTTARPGRRRWAMWAAVTEDLLNDIVAMGLGEGVSLDEVDQQITLPAMGEVTLGLALTVTGVTFECRGDDGGRARVNVSGMGEVSVRGTDYEGDVYEGDVYEGGTVAGRGLGMPAPAAPLPVEVVALCDPYVRVSDDLDVSIGLALRGAELISLDVDHSAEVPAGVDADGWAATLQMTSMMFGSVGHELFAGLGEAVGTVGVDLGPDVGTVLADLGVDIGDCDAQVSSGMLSVGLPATEKVKGRAVPVPISGHRAAVSLATSGVDRLATQLLESALGDIPAPVEIDVELFERRVAAALRQPRLVSDRFPDLRSTMHTDVALRLRGGRLEVQLASAWVELPPFVPSFVNGFNKRLGELWAMTPIRYRLPKRLEVPLGGTPVGVHVDDLRVDDFGVGAAFVLA